MILIGQRYMSEAEPELGLGTIFSIEGKTIKIQFKGSRTERMYALKGAPLKRVKYHAGDEITLRNEEKRTVVEVKEVDGLIQYETTLGLVHEGELADTVIFSRPEERLLSGNIDHPQLFDLRLRTIEFKNQIYKSRVRGLLGPRLGLLPHQYYVADHVTSRVVPRVLLADEVGLGKTIEAGLIIHKLLTTERIRRVLILVPDSLVYQWFIEMLKKFNLHFTTLNQETYLDPESNPFIDNEQVIVNIGLLRGAELAREMIKKANWDLLVIDEAHQLKWSMEQVSIEYKIAELLARRSKGLLLLTATPEQRGLEGHFARLKLIDPARFFDYPAFVEETHHYGEVAKKARALHEEREAATLEKKIELTNTLNELQDLHGTGRIFFRNTRQKMAKEYSFFPRRILHPYFLNHSKKYLGLSDESEFFAEKVLWLIDFLKEKSQNPNKILLLTKSKEEVLKIEKILSEEMPELLVSVFHSGLSFIARDQKAQYFLNPEGAKILLCTEVGSEGRNFECAHDLILFDLPIMPDHLEQRIGRLDRIGQSTDIHIHVPLIEKSFEEILYLWFHEGLNAFLQCAKGASVVHLELQSLLQNYLEKPSEFFKSSVVVSDFISTTKKLFEKISHELEDGRDILVELNSFMHEEAHEITDQITSVDEDDDLKKYLFEVFQELGVDCEDLEEDIYYIHPSDNMYVPHFPCLDMDGLRITFKRRLALKREDVQFITWDHPLVVGVIELILGGNLGNASAFMRRENNGKSKTFLECFFKLDIVAPRRLDPYRFVSLKSIRILIDSGKEDFTLKFSKELIDQKIVPLSPDMIHKLKTLPRNAINDVIKVAHSLALKEAKVIKETAILEMKTILGAERDRLIKLREINPIVREDEIEAIVHKIDILEKAYNDSDVGLDSIRILF